MLHRLRGILGTAITWAVFVLVLMIAERRRSLPELSLRRTAIWGATGALTLPVLFTILDFVQLSFRSVDWTFTVLVLAMAAGLGAVCATATLALARKGLASSA